MNTLDAVFKMVSRPTLSPVEHCRRLRAGQEAWFAQTHLPVEVLHHQLVLMTRSAYDHYWKEEMK